MAKDRMPSGGVSARPLHFFWVVDCSGSMAGEKIESLNAAVEECLPAMRSAAAENVGVQVKMRTLLFSTGAEWKEPDWTDLEQYSWDKIIVEDSVTDIGEAFKLLTGELSMPPMPQRALPPVVVLLSDGLPTDNYEPELEKLLKLPWAKKAVRIAIAIGSEIEDDVLEKFTGNKELILHANNPTALVKMIKWASTMASIVSSGVSRVGENNAPNTDEGRLIDKGIDPSNIPDDDGPVVW